jgi:hypothetical protein
MSAMILLTIGMLGQQSNAASLEFKNQHTDQVVTVWVWDYSHQTWANNQKPIVLRPNMTSRLNLTTGKYRVYFKNDANATLTLDRTLSVREVDRLRIGEPNNSGGPARQMRVFAVRGNYQDYSEATAPRMELPPPR